jgi:putative SOS response-associated peptidase YedK
MCGRYTLATNVERIADLFRVTLPDLRPRYNICPSQPVWAVRAAVDGGREPALLHWGLVPPWADDVKIGYKLINARAETAAAKPAFRDAFRRRRCLVPADGFYEWKKVGNRKQPYHIRLRGGGPFALAGLWEVWRRKDEAVESCTVLTTEPNSVVAPLHDRMPVILQPADYDRWLDPTVTDAKVLKPLLRPFAGEPMEAVAVSTRVNNPRFDGPECLEPAPAASDTLWNEP